MFNVVNGVRLQHFNTNEFRDRQTGISYDKAMCPRLLVMLDVLRHLHGAPIMVSNGRGAIGRDTGTSYHNHRRHGQVQAIDVIPTRIHTQQLASVFIAQAQRLGFMGVGLYPQWLQGTGVHLDVGNRHSFASWGYVDGGYTSLDVALDRLPE